MFHLLGKAIINSTIILKSGMRIGGTTGGLKIGGVELNVITDPEGRPYIPGSSLKGKLRSLYERMAGVKFDRRTGMHQCKTNKSYIKCDVCKIWGTLGGTGITVPTLTRLIVRDMFLDESSYTEAIKQNLDLAWTEIKTETAINRITGTASGTKSLRPIERVPAGAKFKNCQLIFNIFDEGDKDLFAKVFEAMQLLENDYLGGMGSRGYGQVEIKDIEIYWNNKASYESGKVDITDKTRKINNGFNTPEAIVENFTIIKDKLI